jgi:hypothetical protein
MKLIRFRVLLMLAQKLKSAVLSITQMVKHRHLELYFMFIIPIKKVFTLPKEMKRVGQNDMVISVAGLKQMIKENINFIHWFRHLIPIVITQNISILPLKNRALQNIGLMNLFSMMILYCQQEKETGRAQLVAAVY